MRDAGFSHSQPPDAIHNPYQQQQQQQHQNGGNNSPTKAEYLIGQLNVTNAKKVALLLVLGFICYHGLIHLRYGTDSCKWLLSDGRFKGDREWQPYGCMMHKYTQADTRRCFRYLAFWGNENHFVFIGDERMRMLYDAFLRHLHTHDDGRLTGDGGAAAAIDAELSDLMGGGGTSLSPSGNGNEGAGSLVDDGDGSEAAADVAAADDETAAAKQTAAAAAVASATDAAGSSASAAAVSAAAAATRTASAAAALAAAVTRKFHDHSDHEYTNSKLRLRVNYIYANEVNAPFVAHFERWAREPDAPSAIIAGCTHAGFFRGNLSADTLARYQTNLTRLVQPIDTLVARKTKVLWKLQDDVAEEAPDLAPDEWRAIRNADIARYNEAARDILAYCGVQLWSAARRIAAGLLGENVAGWRLGQLARRHDTQLLLNMYCNDNMNYNDGSCCSSAEPYTGLQIVTYAVFAVAVAVAVAMRVRRWCWQLRGQTIYVPLQQQEMEMEAVVGDRRDKAAAEEMEADADSGDGSGDDERTGLVEPVATTSSPAAVTVAAAPLDYRAPLGAMATLALIMTYFYLCDRTNFFMKENKYYSEFSFWIPVGYVFVLGLFFTEDSKYTKVLHRDQTDELKGWMQLVILIYHMTGADRVLPIYMHIKVLISGYLFLSGYGHFTYMWHTGNASVTRLLQILFRLNFSTIVLCLCMNRPYQFYYYVPLISFWFVLVWFVLAVPPQVTAYSTAENGAQLLYLVAKVVCLFAVATVLYMSEVFFERVFVTRPWKALFVTTDDDIHEWWYRWKLDRYTITAGMVFAACFHVAQRHNLFDDNNHGNLFNRRLSIVATLAAIAGVGFYTTFTFMCASKLDCDEIHSYIVFIPIVGYIVLRNISGILRTRFSSFFAWFGRISLELFVCQYHIWLAADRNGVLVLLPGFPNANIIVTSFVFVCVAHEVHRVTHVLLPWAVPNDWRLALRNLAVFVVVLIPIGRYDGMI